MIRLAVIFWLCCTAVVAAAPAVVKTGEHDGFTRLVVDFGTAVKWQVGRTDDGYALRIDGLRPSYDFSDSFRAIGAARLVSLAADPVSGDMTIGVACKCHAIAFEFREGIVVIDMRDGLPPKTSSFEDRLGPAPDPVAEAKDAPIAPAADAEYDWREARFGSGEKAPDLVLRMPAPTAGQSENLASLRETLVGQLGRGASQGIIELAPLEKPQVDAQDADKPAAEVAVVEEDPVAPDEKALAHVLTVPEPGFASVRSGLGELPQIKITTGAPTHENNGAKGESCLSADALNLDEWRGEGEVADQMLRASLNLIGEFDRPDPEAIKSAVQFYLSIGFGAEAKQLLSAFPIEFEERMVLQALADLVDGDAVAAPAFQGQMNCDSPAALWALLENPSVEQGDFVNDGAVYLAFSSLPIELRRGVGSVLADRFLALGNAEMAGKVRDAVLRAPGDQGPQLKLLDASIDMHSGQHAEAEHKLQQVVDDPGPSSSEATVALIEAKVAQNLPVDPVLVAVVAAMVSESVDTPTAEATQRALALAQAASGDFSSAFHALEQQPDLSAIVWRLLSRLGDDDAILEHAVLDSAAAIPNSDDETRTMLASRLLTLGLAAPAGQWLQATRAPDPILIAQISLETYDAKAALLALGELATPEALTLRAAALTQLGENDTAARLYADIGDLAAAQQARVRAQDWTNLQVSGSSDWQSAAIATNGVTLPEGATALAQAPLAYGKTLIEQTSTTRNAVTGLLAQVTPP